MQEATGDSLKQQALKALSDGDTENAVKLLTKSAETHTKTAKENAKKAAQDWVDVGNIAYLNNPKEALDAYNKAIELDNSNIEALNRQGAILYRLGSLDKAIKAFEKILELAADDKVFEAAAAYGNLGLVYQTRGDISKACSSWHIGAKDRIALVQGWIDEDCPAATSKEP